MEQNTEPMQCGSGQKCKVVLIEKETFAFNKQIYKQMDGHNMAK